MRETGSGHYAWGGSWFSFIAINFAIAFAIGSGGKLLSLTSVRAFATASGRTSGVCCNALFTASACRKEAESAAAAVTGGVTSGFAVTFWAALVPVFGRRKLAK